ncbi:MAG: hypothetical protein PHT38_00335 [Halothiobacillus sp.]|jgi:hypothetical protein|nr:hypothetical protein [Halothiobacillus sp.]MDY0146519.1 hypothetical protein [Halothiobacillus sp.]
MKGTTGYLAFRAEMEKRGLLPPITEERKEELRSREDRDWLSRYNGRPNVRRIFENYHQTMMAKFATVPSGQKNHRVLASARIHELRLTNPSSDKEV